MNKDRVIELINEVLEEIHLRGADTKCYVYLDRESGLMVDFSVNKESVSYIDEKRIVTTLFRLLCELVLHDYERRDILLPRSAIIVKCLRQLEGLSQAKFAAKHNIPQRTLENWEKSTMPNLVKLFDIAKKLNINSSVVLNCLESFQV